MNDQRLGDAIQHLRQIVRPERGCGLSDAELLRRWVQDRDEAAFEVLLWRNGPMVLGVCRRILRDAHEAEDALQATFLALARKAPSIGRREAVAAWLYRVAYRAALEARTRAGRRPAQNVDGLESVVAPPAEDFVWRDLRPVLDLEVHRLSAKYRVPFVLRYLEGRTNEEVARELGCPLGTVLSRLGRARELLRSRLTRRGLALSAGAVAVGLSADALSAAVPVGMIGPLVKAAALMAAGQAPGAGLVSANAAALAAGVLKEMTMTKLKVVLVIVLALGLVGVGTGAVAHLLTAGQPAEEPSGPSLARPAQAQPPAAEPPRKAEHRPVQERADPDAKEREDVAQKARLVALVEAKRSLVKAEVEYQDLEKALKHVSSREELVRQDETLRSLERQQSNEREREQEEWKSLHAQAIKGNDGDRARLKDFEVMAKKREVERTERLIDARIKMMREEERLREIEREWGFKRDMALARVRAAGEKVRRLEEEGPPADPEPRALRDIERKLEDLLREVGELRRAVDRKPAKDRAPER